MDFPLKRLRWCDPIILLQGTIYISEDGWITGTYENGDPYFFNLLEA